MVASSKRHTANYESNQNVIMNERTPRTKQASAVALALLMICSVTVASITFAGAVAADESDPIVEFEQDEETLDENSDVVNETAIDNIDKLKYDPATRKLIVLGDSPGSSTGTELYVVDPDTQAIEWNATIDSSDVSVDGVGVSSETIAVRNRLGLTVSVFNRSAQSLSGTHKSENHSNLIMQTVNVDGNDVYMGTDAGASGEYGLHVVTDNGAGELSGTEKPSEFEGTSIDALSVDSGQLTTVSATTDQIAIRDITVGGSVTLSSPIVNFSNYPSTADPIGMQRVGSDIYFFGYDGDTSTPFIQALSYDSGAGTITESWRRDNAEANGNLEVDENYLYARNDDAGQEVGVALNRTDGTTEWSINGTKTTNFTVNAFAAGGSGDVVDVFYRGTAESSSVGILGAINDQLSTGSGSSDGSISVSVDSPHPTTQSITLTSTSTGQEVTGSTVGQPGTNYNLSTTLDGELSEVDRVDVEIYRVNSSGTKLPASPTQDEYYNFTLGFDANGNVTPSSANNSDTQLSLTAESGINRSATTDSAVVGLTLPENVRPSANTQNTTVNGYSWQIDVTPINEDILNDSDPTTAGTTFQVGTLVDATLNTGSVERNASTAFPGDQNVSLAPAGSADAIKVQASGNVQIGVEMSASNLTSSETNDTISATQLKAVGGSGYTTSDYDSPAVTELAQTPVDVGASQSMSNGAEEEIRLWVDYPTDVEPGTYTGNFTVAVSETGAS